MKKIFVIGLSVVLFLFVFSGDLRAQYTIPDKTQKEIKMNPVDARVLAHDSTRFKITPIAQLRYERVQRRKARNKLTFSNDIKISQTGYTNWAEGGTNTLNGTWVSAFNHNYTDLKTQKFNINTLINTKYGLTTLDGKLWKNTDQLQIIHNYNYKMYKKVYYTFNTSLNTQLSKSYAKPGDELFISKPFAPATFNLGLGLTYKLDDKRFITVSPVSGNILIVADKRLSDAGAFGVEPGERTKKNIGLNVQVAWLQPILKDKKANTTILSYRTVAEMFYDYKTKPILNWSSYITFVVRKYFTITFDFTLKYDDRVKPQEGFNSNWQFSETLSFGFIYTINNQTKK